MSSSSSAESASIRAICCISAEDGDCLFPVSADVEAEVDPAEVLGPAVGLSKPDVLGPEDELGTGADVADADGVVVVVLDIVSVFLFGVSSFEAFLRLRICFCRSSRILFIDFNLII